MKRAALGRMCTALRKLKPSLGYLEEVRRHLSRLPSIDPATRTLLITGYPNVGKSSFMNKVSRADVEVQPYAFTTRAVFVGHFDYKDLPWQVLDTPGILDRPLEERNAVEMQAITTLAHLHSAVLYFLDISEQCGFSIAQQVALFNSIKPLFTNKPLFLVCTKVDAQPWETLEPESKAIVRLRKEERSRVRRVPADFELLSRSHLTGAVRRSVKTPAQRKYLSRCPPPVDRPLWTSVACLFGWRQDRRGGGYISPSLFPLTLHVVHVTLVRLRRPRDPLEPR